jgi:hypothetical protein
MCCPRQAAQLAFAFVMNPLVVRVQAADWAKLAQ